MVENKANITKELPPELKKFNWGAFLLTWIWGIGHRVWITLLVPLVFFLLYGIDELVQRVALYYGDPNPSEYLTPIGWFFIAILLALFIYIGIKGNELAWKTGRYNNIEKFLSKEKKWTITGVIFVTIFIIVVPIFAIFSVFIAHNTAYDTMNRSSAREIQSILEKKYEEKKLYCGTNIKELPCDEYTFQAFNNAINYKPKGYKPTNNRYSYKCSNSVVAEGGGKVEVSDKKYTITTYNGDCSKVMTDFILTEGQ